MSDPTTKASSSSAGGKAPSTEDTDPVAPGRLEKLSIETRNLVEDVKTWVDLKLQLLELDIEEKVQGVVNRVLVSAILAILAFLTGVFALVTVALALGSWWYSDTLGFLAVTGLLAAVTLIVYFVKPRVVGGKRSEPKGGLPEPTERKRLKAAVSRNKLETETPEQGGMAPSADGGQPQ